MNRFASFLAIKQGEGRKAGHVIGVMLATAMGAALGGTSIEALFFARFGVDYLPYMYLGLGLTSMVMSFGFTASLSRIPRTTLYFFLPLLVAGLLAGGRFALFTQARWIYPVLWLAKEVFNIFIGLVVWGVAGAVCDTRQAKRLFPLFNASRILGQVAGGLLTGVLVTGLGSENLLFIWSGTLILAAFLAYTAVRGQHGIGMRRRKSRRKQPRLLDEIKRGYQFVRQASILRWISLAAILFSVLYFSIALPFSRAATERYINENALASFLGYFNALTTTTAFFASLFLANRLFARFGIMACLLVFPIIYLIGFGGLALHPVFIIITAFRFIQMVWLSGIADPAYQAMFNVVPPERRDQVKSFIDGVPGQAGIFIAGLVLIVGEQTLEPRQLYWVGLLTAVVCTVAIWQAQRGYKSALVDALRAGHSNSFFNEERPFGGFLQDAATAEAVLSGLKHENQTVRRVSAEILSHLVMPEAVPHLVLGLSDSDPMVRISCLKGLTTNQASQALLGIAASLRDPEPDVRLEAVNALSQLAGFAPGLIAHLAALLEDRDTLVAARAAVSILKLDADPNMAGTGAIREKAIKLLRSATAFGELETRVYAFAALGEWGDTEAVILLTNEMKDRTAPPAITNAVLASLARIDSKLALPYLLDAIGNNDPLVRETACRLLGQIGAPALEPVINAVSNPAQEEGALQALAYLPPPPQEPLSRYIHAAVKRAVEYHTMRSGINHQVRHEAGLLLNESLAWKANEYSIHALRAIGLIDESEAMSLTADILESRDSSQQATFLETLDSIKAKWRAQLKPLLQIWEEGIEESEQVDWERLFSDPDPWLRACALYAARFSRSTAARSQADQLARSDPDAFVRQSIRPSGDTMDTTSTLSLMDRILFLKRVPMFASLSPADLKQVALISEEILFGDGEVIAQEGEQGDELFVIVLGEISVTRKEKDNGLIELARRGEGACVGEMSLISNEPRMATLTAAGEVRVLCIDRKSFEGLIRERPDVSLSVMRELSHRLREAAQKPDELVKRN